MCFKFASNTLRIFRGRWVDHSNSDYDGPCYNTELRDEQMVVRFNQAAMHAGRHTETHKSERPRHIN